MTVIQPPGVQWVVSWLQRKLGLWHFHSQSSTSRNKCVLLGHFILMTVLSHQAHMIWLLAEISIIGLGRDLLGESGIIMNFNDHTVIRDTDIVNYSNERQRHMHFIISRGPDWDHVYMSGHETKTLTDEYSWASKILNAEHKPANLDDVIKTCENLQVEAKHQRKILLQIYEHLLMEN
jgi:hypothetical protein